MGHNLMTALGKTNKSLFFFPEVNRTGIAPGKNVVRVHQLIARTNLTCKMFLV